VRREQLVVPLLVLLVVVPLLGEEWVLLLALAQVVQVAQPQTLPGVDKLLVGCSLVWLVVLLLAVQVLMESITFR
jgi:hypothetical protein